MLPGSSFTCYDGARAALRFGPGWDLYDEPQSIHTGPFFAGYALQGIKDISDVKAYVLWTTYCWTYDDYKLTGPPDIGFFALMENIRLKQSSPVPSEQATTKDVGWDMVEHINIMGDSQPCKLSSTGWESTELGDPGPEVSGVVNNRINWKFYDGNKDTVFPSSHPYVQVALGTEKIDLVSKIKGPDPSDIDMVPRCYVHRTPLKLLCKNNAGFYLNDDVTFEQMPTRYNADSLGTVLTIGKTAPFVNDGLVGELPFSTLAPDTLNESVIFLGLELEFL